MKRRLLIVALFLCLGAVLNVAVAWACAVSIDVFKADVVQAYLPGPEVRWEVVRWTRAGATWFDSRQMRGGTGPEDAKGPSPGKLVCEWSGFSTPTPEFRSGSATVEIRNADGRGWPALSMWSEVRRKSYIRDQGWVNQPVQGGIDTLLPPWKLGTGQMARSVPRVLPLRPIWPGFAVNTISYAAALWFLVRGPFVLRRYVRVKRHLCPECGYPVGVSAMCTECGRAVSPRADSSEPDSSHISLD